MLTMIGKGKVVGTQKEKNKAGNWRPRPTASPDGKKESRQRDEGQREEEVEEILIKIKVWVSLYNFNTFVSRWKKVHLVV